MHAGFALVRCGSPEDKRSLNTAILLEFGESWPHYNGTALYEEAQSNQHICFISQFE